VATRSTAVEELGRLSATLARDWEQHFLATQALGSAGALLAYLESLRGPHILVLDEFPYLTESDPSLPGLLQAARDPVLASLDRTCAVVSRAGFRGRVAAADRKHMIDVAEILAQ